MNKKITSKPTNAAPKVMKDAKTTPATKPAANAPKNNKKK